jgi:hypothetical protein
VYFALQECKAPKGEIPLEPPKPVRLRFDKLAEARVKRGHVLITEGNTIKCRQCLAIVPRCSARQFLTHSGTCTPYNAFESSMAEGGSFKAQLREREWPSDQGKMLFRPRPTRKIMIQGDLKYGTVCVWGNWGEHTYRNLTLVCPQNPSSWLHTKTLRRLAEGSFPFVLDIAPTGDILEDWVAEGSKGSVEPMDQEEPYL